MKTKTMLGRLFFAFFLFPSFVLPQIISRRNIREFIDLGGQWQFCMDESNVGMSEKWFQKSFADSITLPGTLDENRKGHVNHDTVDGHLNRIYNYYGPAWFRKEVVIPKSWSNKQIELILERTKVTHVWVDTTYLGANNTIFSKQVYNLTGKTQTGKHIVTIMIDNTEKLVPVAGSHAYSEDTQTNWNGIIGQFCLSASNPIRIETVRIYPDIHAKLARVKIKISNPEVILRQADINLHAESWNTSELQSVAAKTYSVNLATPDTTLELIYPIGDGMQLWSEFSPVLYELSVTLEINGKIFDNAYIDFGMCEFKTKGTQFEVNDKITFLRGRHDGCVFPLTGYPPMDLVGWIHMFSIVKSYGLNHIRFHSWCPPQAAFKAASILGIYLQPELPIWWSFKGNDSSQVAFMMKEGIHILDNYGNQPSFVMFAMGNEIYQDRRYMKSLVDTLRKYDDRHLYAQGSNNFGGNPSLARGDDYWTTFRTAQEIQDCSSDVRASISFVDSREGGILNTLRPSTMYTYSKAIANSPIPVIGHEIGQYQIYPNFSEIPKYTGVLKPWNLELYRKKLMEKGMGDQVYDFFKASGILSLICYRADIETALRTPGFAGFQLLDLQDYPGQGTALVGILDAFMDSKGLITPDQFRQFCDETVILLVMDKYCWINNESFKANIEIANYGDSALTNRTINWNMVSTRTGELLKTDKITNRNIAQGSITSVGSIECDFRNIQKAEEVLVRIDIEGTTIKTFYQIWIYPPAKKVKVPQTITVATKLESRTMKQLTSGKKVLFFPEFKSIEKKSVPGMFISEFWNYAMFTGFAKQNNRGFSPGTMGILTQPYLPLFNDFPTEYCSNWQWWSIMKNSRPLILDGTNKNYRPLVQVIDNINRNYKLGLIFEFKIGKGKLLVCTANLPSMTDKPEAFQLYSSIVTYMNSEEFNPSEVISPDELLKLLY
jgi:hypothetical protein